MGTHTVKLDPFYRVVEGKILPPHIKIMPNIYKAPTGNERQEGIRIGLRMGLERAADIAKAHIGLASKTRPTKLSGLDSEIAQAIRDEERGEDIAAQEIHRKILAAIEKL